MNETINAQVNEAGFVSPGAIKELFNLSEIYIYIFLGGSALCLQPKFNGRTPELCYKLCF